MPHTPIGDDSPIPRLRYQHSDHLGSSCIETDNAGAVLTYEEYYPFGCTSFYTNSGSSLYGPKRYRYTSKERDEESGFYYHGARYYAPWLGRWTSADPAGMIDGPNLYAYVRNNPVRLHDPNGTVGRGDVRANGEPIINQVEQAESGDVDTTDTPEDKEFRQTGRLPEEVVTAPPLDDSSSIKGNDSDIYRNLVYDLDEIYRKHTEEHEWGPVESLVYHYIEKNEISDKREANGHTFLSCEETSKEVFEIFRIYLEEEGYSTSYPLKDEYEIARERWLNQPKNERGPRPEGHNNELGIVLAIKGDVEVTVELRHWRAPALSGVILRALYDNDEVHQYVHVSVAISGNTIGTEYYDPWLVGQLGSKDSSSTAALKFLKAPLVPIWLLHKGYPDIVPGVK